MPKADTETSPHFPDHPEEFEKLFEVVGLVKDSEEDTSDFPGICNSSNGYALVIVRFGSFHVNSQESTKFSFTITDFAKIYFLVIYTTYLYIFYKIGRDIRPVEVFEWNDPLRNSSFLSASMQTGSCSSSKECSIWYEPSRNVLNALEGVWIFHQRLRPPAASRVIGSFVIMWHLNR